MSISFLTISQAVTSLNCFYLTFRQTIQFAEVGTVFWFEILQIHFRKAAFAVYPADIYLHPAVFRYSVFNVMYQYIFLLFHKTEEYAILYNTGVQFLSADGCVFRKGCSYNFGKYFLKLYGISFIVQTMVACPYNDCPYYIIQFSRYLFVSEIIIYQVFRKMQISTPR